MYDTAISCIDREKRYTDAIHSNAVYNHFITAICVSHRFLGIPGSIEILDQMKGVTLGSDAFFPFSDNIERAHKSGVEYIAEPGGSVRDDAVIECCNKYNMAMAFTGIRLFHH